MLHILRCLKFAPLLVLNIVIKLPNSYNFFNSVRAIVIAGDLNKNIVKCIVDDPDEKLTMRESKSETIL